MHDSLKSISKKLRENIEVYRRAMNHPRTPYLAKWLIWLALGYLALPFDLIPDFIPVLGLLDDVLIVPGLIYLALKQIPEEVMSEIREQQNKNHKINKTSSN